MEEFTVLVWPVNTLMYKCRGGYKKTDLKGCKGAYIYIRKNRDCKRQEKGEYSTILLQNAPAGDFCNYQAAFTNILSRNIWVFFPFRLLPILPTFCSHFVYCIEYLKIHLNKKQFLIFFEQIWWSRSTLISKVIIIVKTVKFCPAPYELLHF